MSVQPEPLESLAAPQPQVPADRRHMKPPAAPDAYTEAVRSGLYAKHSGLTGKYDNVRRYWEDEITRLQLRPYLQRLIERSRAHMRRVRVLDLGCGSADGYELLTGIRCRDAGLQQTEVRLLTPDTFGLYKGVDLNESLLAQARAIYSDNPKMIFQQGDFTQGLPLFEDEKPYDLYFSSYGTCSHHNDDETMVSLLAEIARRVENYAIVVCDWIGRYSYEWQSLWTNDPSERQNMDYVVSYIYPREEREQRRDELQHLWLRLMSRQEAEAIFAEASQRAGVPIRLASCFDRSVWVGRHMDTGEYNPHAQPIREVVNSLHEENIRTDLSTLFIDYHPKLGFPFLNDYYEHLQMCWNTLVEYTSELLECFDERSRDYATPPPPVPGGYPPELQKMMTRMRAVVEGVGWLETGLPRENIIEPQLGYSLRGLISQLQKGLGCGHSISAILEIDKRNGE